MLCWGPAYSTVVSAECASVASNTPSCQLPFLADDSFEWLGAILVTFICGMIPMASPTQRDRAAAFDPMVMRRCCVMGVWCRPTSATARNTNRLTPGLSYITLFMVIVRADGLSSVALGTHKQRGRFVQRPVTHVLSGDTANACDSETCLLPGAVCRWTGCFRLLH